MTKPPLKNEQVGDDYVQYFETLTPSTIDRLDELAVENMRFEDPFNKLQRRDEAKRVFREMFDQIDNPAFKVLSISWNEDRNCAALKWRFTGTVKKMGGLDFEGMSEIRFDEDGKITSHIDFWDAATHFYEKIPFLGTLIRLIKRSIRLS